VLLLVSMHRVAPEFISIQQCIQCSCFRCSAWPSTASCSLFRTGWTPGSLSIYALCSHRSDQLKQCSHHPVVLISICKYVSQLFHLVFQSSKGHSGRSAASVTMWL
jgi:hypothetical protein